jgi:hypothetical protein
MCVCVNECVSVSVSSYVYVSVYTCMCVCVNECVYVHVYVCMWTSNMRHPPAHARVVDVDDNFWGVVDHRGSLGDGGHDGLGRSCTFTKSIT